MNAIHFLLLSIGLYCLGAFISLLLSSGRSARLVTSITSLFAAIAGILAAAMTLFYQDKASIILWKIEPFGSFLLKMDNLSAFMVAIISLVVVAVSLYSLEFAPEKTSTSILTSLFIACMLLVVTTNNALFFLIFWELMTVVSYFLVIYNDKEQASLNAGYLYMLVAHGGVALIMVAFFLIFQKVGSLDFSEILAFTTKNETSDAALSLSNSQRSLIFFLLFFGFGAKAGMVPLHFWLPQAHPAAPSNVSALMSGVMIKTAIYGILRFCIDLLGTPLWWWGVVIITFGAFSAILGAFYALTETQIKKLLAYSSVENIGIMLMGVGLGTIGLASQQPILAVLGILAALYHMLNHAFFKSLLFLGAGTLIHQTGLNNLNTMGGLSRRMPTTALTFLVAALAVSAIPPLNGFASEWFTLQAFFRASQSDIFLVRVISPIVASMMALAGACAVMVYIKAYGSAFSGPAHSRAAAEAKEAPKSVLFSLGYLAAGCLLLGVAAPVLVPRIASVAADVGKVGSPAMPDSSMIPLAAFLLLGTLIVPVLLISLYGGQRTRRRSGVDPWTCGYGYKPSMSVSASNFDQPVKANFGILYRLQSILNPAFKSITAYARLSQGNIQRAEPYLEKVITNPVTRLVESSGQWIQNLQMGDIRVYCFYIILTLVILLIAIFGRSGI